MTKQQTAAAHSSKQQRKYSTQMGGEGAATRERGNAETNHTPLGSQPLNK
jgi:hypothetical protein